MQYTVEKLRLEQVTEASKLTERVMRRLRDECTSDELPDEAVRDMIRQHDKLYYSTLINNPLKFAFTVTHKGKIVGLAIGSLCGGGGVAHLQWICVDPEYRGRGVGTTLLTTVIDYVRKTGCHKLTLYTVPCLKNALSMYLSEGFRVEGHLIKHWWKSDFLLLSRIIKS